VAWIIVQLNIREALEEDLELMLGGESIPKSLTMRESHFGVEGATDKDML